MPSYPGRIGPPHFIDLQPMMPPNMTAQFPQSLQPYHGSGPPPSFVPKMPNMVQMVSQIFNEIYLEYSIKNIYFPGKPAWS
jgi:hypothetical protein